MFPLFAWLWRACISIESLAQRLHKLHLSQVSGAYYTLSGDKLSRGVSEKICGSAAGCSLGLGAADLVTPSALRTTRLVYTDCLNPIAGCAYYHSYGDESFAPHSRHPPPRHWAELREAGGWEPRGKLRPGLYGNTKGETMRTRLLTHTPPRLAAGWSSGRRKELRAWSWESTPLGNLAYGQEAITPFPS